MLKLSMLPDEYLTINGSIVVQLIRVAGGRAYVAVEAARDIPILRGDVLERGGGERPACLIPPRKKPRHYRDRLFRWNDDREQAARIMKQVMDRLDQKGAGEEAEILRTQLERIIPACWEKEAL